MEEVIEHTCKQVVLFGTQRTVGSGKYHLELGKRNEIQTKIEAVATSELVPLLEKGELDEAVAKTCLLIKQRVNRGDKIDGVILGCTHYNLMLNKLRQEFPSITFFGQAEIIPVKVADYLNIHPELETQLTRGATRNIFLTEHRADYDQHLQELLEGKFLKDDE